MPNVGPMELMIVAMIALMVIGPRKLPDAARGLGTSLREFKSAVTGPDDAARIEESSRA